MPKATIRLDNSNTRQHDRRGHILACLCPNQIVARVIRRVMIAALVERDVDLDVVRADLHKLIAAQIGDALVPSAA